MSPLINQYPSPPGPKGIPFVGNALDFRRDPLGFLTRVARDYGDIVNLKAGRQQMIFINDPGLIENILATNAQKFTRSKSKPPTRLDYFLSGGEDVYRVINFPGDEDFWVRERRRVNPLLKGNSLSKYGPTMVAMAERHTSTWDSGEIRDIHQEMLRITIDIVLNSLYGLDFPNQRTKILKMCETIVRDISHRATHPFQAPPIFPTKENIKLRKAVNEGRELIRQIIQKHPEIHEGGGDLIDMLRRAQNMGTSLLDNPDWQYQIIALLIAGHETTAVALTWTWYLLSQHPSIANQVFSEVDEKLKGRIPSKTDIPNLPLCNSVFKEALRLYPPVPIIPRMTYGEMHLGNYWIAPGTVLLISPWVIHRDVRFFSKPSHFCPERWIVKPEPQRYSYLPFSGGPRTCVGQNFAITESLLAIAYIAQRYRLELIAGEQPKPTAWVGLRPDSGMKMEIHSR